MSKILLLCLALLVSVPFFAVTICNNKRNSEIEMLFRQFIVALVLLYEQPKHSSAWKKNCTRG